MGEDTNNYHNPVPEYKGKDVLYQERHLCVGLLEIHAQDKAYVLYHLSKEWYNDKWFAQVMSVTPKPPKDHQHEGNDDLKEFTHRIQMGHILLYCCIDTEEREYEGGIMPYLGKFGGLKEEGQICLKMSNHLLGGWSCCSPLNLYLNQMTLNETISSHKTGTKFTHTINSKYCRYC